MQFLLNNAEACCLQCATLGIGMMRHALLQSGIDWKWAYADPQS